MTLFQKNLPEPTIELPATKLGGIDYELEAHIAGSCMATVLMEPLLRYNAISASIMIGFVLSYADSRRPTVSVLYRCYQAQIALHNQVHSKDEPLPLLSKYIFRASIDRMDPAFVLAARYGPAAANKYYLRRLHSDYRRRAATARAAEISPKAI
ncbi:hypothetical protein HFN87_27730 [Rhizobium laguerreae]|uniref:hypothetical protein n=1 Tax=Rhizobium laguerreae TaxID=1076926 RepID=UPI001C91F056|nr:hypothetical protein [Rhizobium laguerreae]MBY3417053.1 hypothetical protein [Rhizobium laguerreae]